TASTRMLGFDRASASSVGSSFTHGAHQLAHRFTSSGLPVKSARCTGWPSGSLNGLAGAGLPRWLRSTPFTGAPGSAAIVLPAVVFTSPPYPGPARADEIAKRSDPRPHDPFAPAPPSGGAAPAVPAGTAPEPAGQTTGKTTTDTPGE